MKADLSLNFQDSKQLEEETKKKVGPFIYSFKGQLAYIGGKNSLVEVSGNVKFSGFFSW